MGSAPSGPCVGKSVSSCPTHCPSALQGDSIARGFGNSHYEDGPGFSNWPVDNQTPPRPWGKLAVLCPSGWVLRRGVRLPSARPGVLASGAGRTPASAGWLFVRLRLFSAGAAGPAVLSVSRTEARGRGTSLRPAQGSSLRQTADLWARRRPRRKTLILTSGEGTVRRLQTAVPRRVTAATRGRAGRAGLMERSSCGQCCVVTH